MHHLSLRRSSATSRSRLYLLLLVLVVVAPGIQATSSYNNNSNRRLLRRAGQEEQRRGAHFHTIATPSLDSTDNREDTRQTHRSLGKGKGGGKKGNTGDDDDDEEDSPDDQQEEEPQEEECVGDVKTIKRSVLLNLVGAPNANIDADQLMALEDAFQLAYNRLGQTLCEGGAFRFVVDVSAILDEGAAAGGQGQPGRDLQFGEDTDSTDSTFTIFLNIVFQCNSCGDGAELFLNDAARRMLVLGALEGQDHSSPRFLREEQADNSCNPCELPTPEIFIVNYKAVLEEFIDDGRITDIVTPDSVSELEDVPCDANVQVIQTSLAIEFRGDPAEASDEELEILSNSVRSTINALNGLNDAVCDPLFRVVVSVEANLDDISITENLRRRHLQFNNNFVINPFLIFFNIVFQCRGCPGDTLIFVDDAARRQLDHFTKPNQRRRIQSVPSAQDECLCAIGVDEFRPPTRDEFDIAFNETVTILIAQEDVDFIAEVGGTIEVEEISCPATVEERLSRLIIQAQGDPEAFPADDITALEDAIEATLNELYSRFCDPEVRTVIEVTFAGFGVLPNDTSAGRNLQFETDDESLRPYLDFFLFFQIVFQCRGCPVDAGLFGDDASRRHLEYVSSSSEHKFSSQTNQRRQLPVNGDQCFCDTDVVNELRAPTLEEFTILFNDTLADLNLVTNVTITVLNEAEVTPSPVTESPITTSPTTTAPVTATPVTANPVTATPVTANPVTATPFTANPVTATPVTAIPSMSPTNKPVSTAPSATTMFRVESLYEVAFRDGVIEGGFVDDLVAAVDQLAAQVVSETFDNGGRIRHRRRRLAVRIDLPSSLIAVIQIVCPSVIVARSDTCSEILHSITIVDEDGTDISDRFLIAFGAALLEGRLQTALDEVNADSSLYIVTGLTNSDSGPTPESGPVLPSAPPVAPPSIPATESPVSPQPTNAPVTPQPTEAPVTPQPTEAPVTPQPTTAAPVPPTMAPISAAPVVHPNTDNRRICYDNEVGSVVCDCRLGYDGPTCSPIDECSQDPSPCDFPGAFCVDRSSEEGFYECGCRTNDGWLNGDSSDDHGLTSCLDKNECTSGDPPCHPDATCINLSPDDGRFECTCNGDLVGDGRLECKAPPTATPTSAPVDPLSPEAGCQSDEECTVLNEVCDASQIPPSCECDSGYFRLGANCQLENACEDSDRNNCDVGRAECNDLMPGFSCTCSDGWVDAPGTGDAAGVTCIDKDECSTGDDDCDANTHVCVNRTPPSKWDCVLKTPSPTPPPTPPPTAPRPLQPTCNGPGVSCTLLAQSQCCSNFCNADVPMPICT